MQYENYFLDGRLIMTADTSIGWFEGEYRGNIPFDTEGSGLMIPDVSPEIAERIKRGDEEALHTVIEQAGDNIYKGREGRILYIATKIKKSMYSYIPLATKVEEVNPDVGRVFPEAVRRAGEHAVQRARL